MRPRRYSPVPAVPSSAFVGFRFPPEVIVLAVRWYLRFGLSYRDVEELLGERGIEVDHVTIYRWVQRFTPLLADAAVPCRPRVGDRWFADETYVKIAGRWRYVYRAVDQYGQIIDVMGVGEARLPGHAPVLRQGDPLLWRAGRSGDRSRFRRYGLRSRGSCRPRSATLSRTRTTASNVITAGSKARLRPIRRLKRDHTAPVIMRGTRSIQNIRRGHYELGVKRHCPHLDASSTRSTDSPGQSERQTGREHDPARVTTPLNATAPYDKAYDLWSWS